MKRSFGRLGALLTLTGALVACRPAIAPARVNDRQPVSAAPPAQLSACWVESGRAAGFTASAIVVRHPQGAVLIDGGNSSEFSEEIEVYEGRHRRWLAMFPGSLKPRQPLDSLLRAAQVDPEGFRWLLPTHAHLDHMGGFVDLPPTPVLLTAPERALVERGRDDVITGVVPAHAHAVAPVAQTLRFTDAPYEIFDRHADLFGDHSVVVVPLFGHTPGSVGVFINLPDGRRIFHVGDAVNNRRQIQRRRGRTPAMRRTDADRPTAESVVGQLHELAVMVPELEFLPAHERDAWEDAFGAPRSPTHISRRSSASCRSGRTASSRRNRLPSSPYEVSSEGR